MTELETKLIQSIIANSTKIEGKVSVSKRDGVQYRYDRYIFNHKAAANWLVSLFEKVAGNSNQIQIGNFSIYYDRSIYKNTANGIFKTTELIEFN